MRIAVVTVTRGGVKTGARIKAALGEDEVTLYGKKEHTSGECMELKTPLGEFIGKLVESYDALVFVTAVGVAVRSLAGHMKGKLVDPPVVVVDEMAGHAVSLLGGHHGANTLAVNIASRIGADPVITTSTDVQGRPSVEVLAAELGLKVEGHGGVKAVNAAIANGEAVDVFMEADLGMELPPELSLKPWEALVGSMNPKIVVTNKLLELEGPAVLLRPRNLIIGLGAGRGRNGTAILEAVREGLEANSLSIRSVRALATLRARAAEEGFIEAAGVLGVPLIGIDRAAIREVEGDYSSSEFVRGRVGVGAVCEPCAVLAGSGASLIVPKTRFRGITLAVAEEKVRAAARAEGKVYVVGLGPGAGEHITPRAVEALKEAEVVVSYKGYLPYIREHISGKEVLSGGMGSEVERAKTALKHAGEGRRVAVVSSGDPGVYAMASVVLECAREAKAEAAVEVVPGITAASAASALLGAPLGHDFAVVSLSDLLTPWEVIERRLEEAAKGDFCIVLYNPKSRGRREHLGRAVEILRRYRASSTPVGVVRNAMREGEEVVVTTLGALPGQEVDMRSVVIIGNSESFTYRRWMVTPRGYKGRYREEMR